MFPARRVTELARYGLAGKAPLLRRHDDHRRLATLLATAVRLQARAVDDALELLDLLMTTRLLAQAERESAKEKIKRLPRLNAESAKLAAAVAVLIEATPGPGDDVDAAAVSLAQVWERIEQVVPRSQLAAALRTLGELLPAPDSDEDAEWRAELVSRYGSVRGFLPMLTEVIDFGATVESTPVLQAMRLTFYNPAKMKVERYRFRGAQISTPYNIDEVDPDGARFRRTGHDDQGFVGQVSELMA
ncbi:hypothetical protein ACQP1W_24910 [Spirillospora sp. CA-255316]